MDKRLGSPSHLGLHLLEYRHSGLGNQVRNGSERDRELSSRLKDFLREYPYERHAILDFVINSSAQLPSGSHILDAGAGDAPYRELFHHCTYVTCDYLGTMYHDKDRYKPDIECDLRHIPTLAKTFDAILCTQVLEHIDDPLAVLREFHRILKPGGHLFLTVPFMWPVHMQPYDFYRYTPFSLRNLFSRSDFLVQSIHPHCGYFTTIAQLIHGHRQWLLPFKQGPLRHITGLGFGWLLTRVCAPLLVSLDKYDRARTFTLGYACHCTRADLEPLRDS